MKGGVSGGNYFGARLGLHYIHKEKYVLQLSYSPLLRIAKSLPRDYDGGLFDFLTFGLTTPVDQIESYEMLMGKAMLLDDNKKLRLQLKGGLAFSIITEPTNWEKIDRQFLIIIPKYTYEESRKNELSLVLNPSIEYAFSPYFGIGASAHAILNKERIAVGMGVDMMIGILRSKKRATLP